MAILYNYCICFDSYCYNIINTGIIDHISKKYEFWYYNRTISPRRKGNKKVKDLDYYKEILKFDVVLLMASEANYYRFGYDFIEKYYNLSINYQPEIQKIINRIKADSKWLEKVKKQAVKRKIHLNSMLKRVAKYIIKNRKA